MLEERDQPAIAGETTAEAAAEAAAETAALDANAKPVPKDYVFSGNESARTESFSGVWTEELNDAFADIAQYYDRANHVASLGLWNWFKKSFIGFIDVKPKDKLLDVCAGTMAVSLALMNKQPDMEAHAVDRSAEMLAVGSSNAKKQGVQITARISDVHKLPFPDNTFNVVTLQYASRHLRVIEVFKEIQRVLVPGGHFYHCDMLRPGNKIVETLYYGYLKLCLNFTAFMFRSNPSAQALKKYFIEALQMFYSSAELSELLQDLGYTEVKNKNLLSGMIGIHSARKPLDS